MDANGTIAMSAPPKPATHGHRDAAVDRVLRALNHPVRRRILQELSEGSASASTLAKRFDLELGAVSYHLNQVLARECGVVVLVDTIARRGALEKIYGLDTGVWEQLAHTPGPGAGVYGLFPLEVDNSAWREICEAREEFEERIAAAVEGSHRRGVGIGLRRTRRVIVGVAAFSPREAPHGAHPELEADDRT